jgi:hypothetical protein
MLVQPQINLLALSRLEVFGFTEGAQEQRRVRHVGRGGELHDFRVGAFLAEVRVTLLNDWNRNQIP